MSWLRALLLWLAIILAESVHGALRQVFLAPRVGDLPARQLGVFIGSLIILAIACAGIRWIRAGRVSEQLRVGLAWVVLTLAFEWGLGTVLGYSRERMLADYNPLEGGWMVLGLAFMLVAPALAARIRDGVSGGRRS